MMRQTSTSHWLGYRAPAAPPGSDPGPSAHRLGLSFRSVGSRPCFRPASEAQGEMQVCGGTGAWRVEWTR
eukprot:528483-Hanusia_phi.AAC.1